MFSTSGPPDRTDNRTGRTLSSTTEHTTSPATNHVMMTKYYDANRAIEPDLLARTERSAQQTPTRWREGGRRGVPAVEALVEVDGVLPGDHLLLPRRRSLLLRHLLSSPPLSSGAAIRLGGVPFRRREKKTLPATGVPFIRAARRVMGR